MAAPKGHPKWGGRKPGVRNKNYLDPNFWTAELHTTVSKMGDKEKAEAIFRLLGMLFSKIQVIPLTPTQSLENVNEMMNKLETTEQNASNV